jgi:hypothetical protein
MVSQSVTQLVSMMLPTTDVLLPVTLNDMAGTAMAKCRVGVLQHEFTPRGEIWPPGKS